MWLPSGALLIGADRIDTGRVGDQVNPATGAIQAEFLPRRTRRDLLAVDTARSAFGQWRTFQPDTRRQLLRRFGE